MDSVCLFVFPLLVLFTPEKASSHEPAPAPDVSVIQVRSRADRSLQPSVFIPAQGDGPRPLLVYLHTWSGDYRQPAPEWREGAVERNWHFLQPDFRGRNNTPEACASRLALEDVLDAVKHVRARFDVDDQRIYLAGVSGGGHMTLMMAAHAPELWTAASAWCPISDLAAWHAETRAAGRDYWRDIESVVGGAPGSARRIDKELAKRSPLHRLEAARRVALEISTGIHDGHTGSVPVHHTLDAFNVIARANGARLVSNAEIERLSHEQPLDTSEEQDPSYGRQIHLRRYAGNARVTIFEGTHEGIAAAAFAWFEQHESRSTQ